MSDEIKRPNISNEDAEKLLKERQARIEAERQELIREEEERKRKATEAQLNGENNKLTSLGKSKIIEEKKQKRIDAREAVSDIGWKTFPIINLPSRGLFYPDGTAIQIRSSNVQEIRHFSTIEEEDLIDIDDKLNFIIDKCTRISFPGRRATFKDLLEIDRFALIFAIRELTFKDGENKLQMNVNCNKCGNSDIIEINKNNFNFFTLHDDLKRFYNVEERCLLLKTKTGQEIRIYIPTLGVTNFIKNLIREKSQKNEYYDKSFLKIAPFVFKSWTNLNEKEYNKINNLTFNWDIKTLSIIIKVIDLLQDSISPEIEHTCTSCGAEVKAPISFQGGIKSLFLDANPFDGLV